MYSILNGILKDHNNGPIFNCFGVWHFVYLGLALALIFVLSFSLKNKNQNSKEKAIKILSGVAFGLYMADFFLMPFAYGMIDIDKLPFHSCTLMSILCFLSNRNKFLRKYRINFALLALISNLIYVVYPAGVMWFQITPYSYRTIQTLTFHLVMVVYSLIVLIFGGEKLEIKKCGRDLIILVIMSSWALLGNTLYSGNVGDYNHDFNWFFVKYDPLGIFATDISPYIMPWLNIIAFFGIEIIIYLIYMVVANRKSSKKNEEKELAVI